MIEPLHSPFWNIRFVVTSEFDPTGTISGRTHNGLDIATFPADDPHPPLYSMVNGYIYYKSYDEGGFGYYVIIKADNGIGYLYAHMNDDSLLSVGDRVTPSTIVGYEGDTGYSTGLHLHLEMQDLSNREWVYRAPASYYLNPADYMGVVNEENYSRIYYYNGYEPTPTPSPWYLLKSRFPWACIKK